MTASAFQRIAAGLQEARAAVILAKSDAEFDGRTFAALGRADQARYIQRAVKGLAAVAEVRSRPLIAEAITTVWGERCSSFDHDCAGCWAWMEYDEI